MADRLVNLILKNIDKDKLLQVQYERLLVEYTRSLFSVTDSVFDDGYRSLLRYADLLSISELEIHNNLAIFHNELPLLHLSFPLQPQP